MFDSIFGTEVGGAIDIGDMMKVFLVSLGIGLLIAFIYSLNRKENSFSYLITLVVLPIVVSFIIILVGTSIARAFSLAGIFTLVRFRSEPGDPKDITYILLDVAIGLACGMGYLFYAFLLGFLTLIIIFILEKVRFIKNKMPKVRLKIIVPENLNYQNLFDDVLERYTKKYDVERVKTTDFGTTFEITYVVTILDKNKQKEFIDELRCRNGNLNISLTTIFE